MGEDRRRQRVHTSAHQRRGRRNLVAKKDRFFFMLYKMLRWLRAGGDGQEVMQYKKPNKVDLQLSNSAMEPINHRRIEEHGS
jgi:hypothetical protein